MTSFVMHLAIAKLYLGRHIEETEEEFIEGTISPDLTDDKPASHFGKHCAWADPGKYLIQKGDRLVGSFERAYFLHLLTDYLFYHQVVNIEECLATLGIEEWIRRQRNDFSVLNDEIVQNYDLKNIPDAIKGQMTSKDGELEIFDRKKIADFIQEVSQVDIDEIAKKILENPESDLVDTFEKYRMIEERNEKEN